MERGAGGRPPHEAKGKRWFIPALTATLLVALTFNPSAAHLRKKNGERVSKAHARVHKQQQSTDGGTVSSGDQAAGQAATDPVGVGGGNDDFYYSHHVDRHGGVGGHLPATQENVDVVGQLKLVNFADDVSDVTAMATSSDGTWYAYVGDWGAKCQTGGVHVVDISDPSNPTKVGFLNSGGTGYVTEGLQALHIDTTDYEGDILVVSNEWCLQKSNPKLNPGGISIWDINDPTDPKLLVDGFGDFDIYGNRANESHSAIAWDAGDGDAYVAAIDNEEIEDVDSFEITDPASPQLLSETGLPGVNVNAYGSEKTSPRPGRPPVPERRVAPDGVRLGRRVDRRERRGPLEPHHRGRLRLRGLRPGGSHRVPARGQRPPGRVEQRWERVRRDGRGLEPVPPAHRVHRRSARRPDLRGRGVLVHQAGGHLPGREDQWAHGVRRIRLPR